MPSAVQDGPSLSMIALRHATIIKVPIEPSEFLAIVVSATNANYFAGGLCER